MNSPVVYREIAPPDALKPHVYCFWVLRNQTSRQTRVNYRIVADGCVDLFINCSTFEGLFIAGTARSSAVVPINGQAVYFGIRFLPGRFSFFFRRPLKDLSDRMVACTDVWGRRLERLESRLFSASSMQARMEIAESFLLRRLAAVQDTPGKRFLTAVDNIFQHQGHLRLDGDFTLGLSPRQLRRLFDRHIGVSPKSLARIVRFQSVLRTMMQVPEKEWGQRCLDFGYYDQAHFIREFKAFSGLTPMSSNFSQK